MIEIRANTVLLDIEGAISSYTYIHEVLFPFAVNNARSYLERCWDNVETLTACDSMAREAGFKSSYEWLNPGEIKRQDMIDTVLSEIERLTKADSHSNGLKELQSFIWAEAYATGRLCSQVFDDVPQALACWKAAKILMAVFASRINTAQREFMEHTEYGSLVDYFAGFFDLSCGSMTDPSSYDRIARLLNRQASEIVFVSDPLPRLEAAHSAGMQTLRLLRPGSVQQKQSIHTCAPSLYDVRILPQESLV